MGKRRREQLDRLQPHTRSGKAVKCSNKSRVVCVPARRGEQPPALLGSLQRALRTVEFFVVLRTREAAALDVDPHVNVVATIDLAPPLLVLVVIPVIAVAARPAGMRGAVRALRPLPTPRGVLRAVSQLLGAAIATASVRRGI